MQSKKLKVTFITLTSVATALIIAFIFSNSLKVPSVSTGQSQGLYQRIVNIVTNALGENFANLFFGFFTPYLLRKLAHVIEYMALGVSVNLLILSIFGRKKLYLILSLSIGLTVSSLDEILQIFSSRGARVSDVLLDFISFSMVTLIFLIIYLILEKKDKMKRNNNQ